MRICTESAGSANDEKGRDLHPAMLPPSSRTLAFCSLHRDNLADPAADTGQALLEDCDLLFSAEPVGTAFKLFLRHCQHAIVYIGVDTYEMLLCWT